MQILDGFSCQMANSVMVIGFHSPEVASQGSICESGPVLALPENLK